MSAPTVSVVIPAYKAAGFIARALDGVLGQTCPPAEVLVIDDGSPDDMAAAVRPYGDRVTLVRKPNGGAASARNLGLDLARGEFVAFLDADDYWAPTKLERQLAAFGAHPELGLVCGRWYEQFPGGPQVPPPAIAGPDYDRVLRPRGPEAFRLATQMWTGMMLVRRSVIGDMRFTSGLEPAEDRDLWVRLAAAAPVYLVSDPLATYVQEPGSLSRTNVERDYGNMLRVVRRHGELLGRRERRRWEAETFRRWAARYMGNGEPRAALRPAWQRLVRNPLSVEGWWILLKSGLTVSR